jgi:HSP20 family molecular chaperone IbpA
MEKICFLSSLPDIQSAINISGTGNGVRLKLDVPETEIAEVIKLTLLRGKAFKVTIEEVE